MTALETISTRSLQVAHELLKIEAVKLSPHKPFTWTSGIKSPIYCDNRIVNSNVPVRDFIVGKFVDLIHEEFPQTEIIAAVATGGIPIGILIADRLHLPFIYVREKPKEHGLMKQIEGDYKPGDKVVLIEDHISTGKSSIVAIHALRDAGLDLLCLASIMTYGFPEAKYRFKEADLDTYLSLSDFDAILETAIEEGRINQEEKETIKKFRENPRDWYLKYMQ